MMLAACAPSVPEEYHQAQRLYRQNKLTEALPLFEQALSKMPSDAEAHAWLAETYRRLGRREEAVSLARRALALAPCNSFAHTVIADAYNPMYGIWESADSDSTWTHLQRAVACDSTDGNAWVNMWTEAMRRGETAIAGRTLATAAKAGFFAPAALAYCRWMLQNLPEQALLVTNGDSRPRPFAPTLPSSTARCSTRHGMRVTCENIMVFRFLFQMHNWILSALSRTKGASW
ncbi:tetratricopeptide repeat protein [candidate division KSB1 bacterium]|nr:tetratricopeptide repeat protein [candidate division KSB1 bacterium]